MYYPKVGEYEVFWGKSGANLRSIRGAAPRHKIIADRETGTAFAVVSKSYQLVRHEEALDLVEEAIARNPEFGSPIRNISLSPDGARMWAKYRFPQTEYDIGGIGGRGRDLINPTIDVQNSYDTGWAFSIHFGAYRLVCSNGLRVGKTFVHYRHRHTRGLDPQRIQKILVEGMEKYSYQVDLWRSWVSRVTQPQDYERVMEGMGFRKGEADQIHKEVERSSDITLDDIKARTLSYWIFYNIVTQYITHRVTDMVRRADLMSRVQRAF